MALSSLLQDLQCATRLPWLRRVHCYRPFTTRQHLDLAPKPSTLASFRMATSVAVREQITLTDEEKALFDTLLAAAQHAGTGTVLRCAGGWVRDKLLGKESKDIDIALDNMLGKEFAEKVWYGCQVVHRRHIHVAVCTVDNGLTHSTNAIPACTQSKEACWVPYRPCCSTHITM